MTVLNCQRMRKNVMVEGRDASTVTVICNRYPGLGVSWQVIPVGPHSLGQVVQLRVRMEYEDDDLQIPSFHYPINRFESWWIVITEMNDINTSIHSIKCITVTSSMV